MKIRNGFVSNSSSSSFIVYGAKLDTDKQEEFNYSNLYRSELTLKNDVLGECLMSEVESYEFDLIHFDSEKIKQKVESYAKDNNITLKDGSFGLYAGNTEN